MFCKLGDRKSSKRDKCKFSQATDGRENWVWICDIYEAAKYAFSFILSWAEEPSIHTWCCIQITKALSLDEFNFLLHMCSSSLDACLSLNAAAHMGGNGYQGTGCENAYVDYECQAFCGRTQLFPGCCQRQ